MAEDIKDEHGKVTHVSFETHAAITQKMQDAEKRAQRFEGEIAELKKNSVKAEDYNSLKEKLAALEEKSAGVEDSEQFRSLVEERAQALHGKVEGDYKKTIAELNQKLEHASDTIHEFRVVETAMKKVGGRVHDDMQDVLKDEIRRNASVDEEGNLFIKDKDGDPIQRNGARLTIEDFVNDLAEKRPSMFRPQAKSGGKESGTKQPATSNGAGNNGLSTYLDAEKRKALSPAERIKHAPEALRHLSEQFNRE